MKKLKFITITLFLMFLSAKSYGEKYDVFPVIKNKNGIVLKIIRPLLYVGNMDFNKAVLKAKKNLNNIVKVIQRIVLHFIVKVLVTMLWINGAPNKVTKKLLDIYRIWKIKMQVFGR